MNHVFENLASRCKRGVGDSQKTGFMRGSQLGYSMPYTFYTKIDLFKDGEIFKIANQVLPQVLILLRLLKSLVLGSSILKPNFDLSLGQLQRLGQLVATLPGNVLADAVLGLQPQGLLATEGRPLSSGLTLFSPLFRPCKGVEN